MVGEGEQRRARGFLGRIEEGDVAQQRQVRLVERGGGAGVRGQVLAGDGDDAEAVLVEPQGLRLQRLEVAGVERKRLAAALAGAADIEDLLDSPFADQHPTVLPIEHDRHAAAHEVERDLVDLAVAARRVHPLMDVGVAQHRFVEQVLQSGLVEAVEVGVGQDLVAGLSVQVLVALQDDGVLRQRARLVGAQDVHRAEVLDRVQVLDDHLAARHRHRALGQVDGDEHRQHLRRQADADRRGEQQGLHPVALGQAVDQEDERHHDGDEADHQPGEAREAAIEVRHRRGGTDRLGDAAEHRAGAGVDDQRRRRAARHVGAHEAHVGEIERLGVRSGGRGRLLHGHGLARHRRLVDEQVLGRQHAHVGRHDVADAQVDDVSRHQLLDRQLARHPAARHGGVRAHHGLQLRGGAVRAPLLHEGQRHAQHDHQGDQDRGLAVACAERQGGQRDQQHVQRIGEPPQHLHRGALGRRRGGRVAAMDGEPLRRDLLRQAGRLALQAAQRGRHVAQRIRRQLRIGAPRLRWRGLGTRLRRGDGRHQTSTLSRYSGTEQGQPWRSSIAWRKASAASGSPCVT